jgi:hypothetical protein
MWRFRQARRLPVLSVPAVGAVVALGAYGTVKPTTMGAFAGPVRRNPSC